MIMRAFCFFVGHNANFQEYKDLIQENGHSISANTVCTRCKVHFRACEYVSPLIQRHIMDGRNKIKEHYADWPIPSGKYHYGDYSALFGLNAGLPLAPQKVKTKKRAAKK